MKDLTIITLGYKPLQFQEVGECTHITLAGDLLVKLTPGEMRQIADEMYRQFGTKKRDIQRRLER